ncbi:MAG TPA: hypothetical protein VLU24_09125 [Mycobacterium sp.]|nr:hypothetical protein [Mycobacterium sp.]
MKTIRWQALGLLCAILVYGGGAAYAGEILIDHFSSSVNQIYNDDPGNPPLNVSQLTVGSTTVLDTGLPDVLGGSRDLTVTATMVLNPIVPDRVTAGIVPAPLGFLQYSSTDDANGSFQLVYNRNGAGLNADLSKAIGIEMDFLADLSAPPYDVTLTLSDNNSTFAVTQTVLCPALSCPDPEVIVRFHFADFPGINPARIQSIQLNVDPQDGGADLLVDRLVAFGTVTPMPVMSPGAVGGLALSLSLVGVWGHRRRVKATRPASRG